MELDLSGKVALVAGSSRGIGYGIARSLLKEGAALVITGRDDKRLEQALARLKSDFPGSRVLSSAGDLRTPEGIEAALDKTGELGEIDLLAANVGSGRAPLGEILEYEAWSESFDMNFWSSVRVVQAVLPSMQARASGSIVLIGSIAGLEAVGAPIPYSAAKAALAAYMKSLSASLGPMGIRVNCVAPGNVIFPGGRWEELKSDDPAGVERMVGSVPLRRLGQVEEIADVVAFVLSPRASFVTGACLVVDGGQTRAFG